MRYNEPEIKIKISCEILDFFLLYLLKCTQSAFIDSHNFYRVDPVRESLLSYSLNSLLEKTSMSAFKNRNESKQKIISLKMNKAERVTMSIMLKRIEAPAYLASLEHSILKQLTYEHHKI